jgi:ferritin-like metal-binding protein YciE
LDFLRCEERLPTASPMLKIGRLGPVQRIRPGHKQKITTIKIETLMKTLEDLFLDSLADMYYAEKQLTKALPKMAKTATNEDLRTAFEKHLAETEGHVEKVEAVFEAFGKSPKSKKCPAILGIIEEADEMASENKKSPTINAALIFAGQKAEHYEIASYGGLRDWAKLLGNEVAAEILEKILEQEKAADAKLSELASVCCNESAKGEEKVAKNRLIRR